jgi:hypothetical protein
MNKALTKIIETFDKIHQVSDADFSAFLITDNDTLRGDLVHYFTTHQHIQLARYLLTKAVEERKNNTGQIYIEDLCLFSYFVAAHHDIEDVMLIWSAKYADFDTWAGFDGELLSFMGVEKTCHYLQSLNTEAATKAMDYVKNFQQEDIDFYFSEEHYYF